MSEAFASEWPGEAAASAKDRVLLLVLRETDHEFLCHRLPHFSISNLVIFASDLRGDRRAGLAVVSCHDGLRRGWGVIVRFSKTGCPSSRLSV